MLLLSKNVAEIQKAIDSGRHPPEALRGCCRASLPVALFLALAQQSIGDWTDDSFIAHLGVPQVKDLALLLKDRRPQRPENPFGTYPFEAYRITSRTDLLSENWIYFCDRFRRAASRGKQSSAILAVVSVLREMADNVVCHAYELDEKPCDALAAYHVSEHGMCFSVADNGQGFLRSLLRNPNWKSLKTDRDALSAIVLNNATSRIDERCGGGFKQLFSGLLNLDGLVFLRSYSANFTLRNARAAWEKQEHTSHPVNGSQVTLILGNGKRPEEVAL